MYYYVLTIFRFCGAGVPLYWRVFYKRFIKQFNSQQQQLTVMYTLDYSINVVVVVVDVDDDDDDDANNNNITELASHRLAD